jgi:pimeloyl-ACP methyl ester carboxylesterase
VIAHSAGVYVGLALASQWFGIRIESLFGLGPKVTWVDAEVTSMLELARKPARDFPTEADAWARYRKVSGLDAQIAPDAAALARGVHANGSSYRLAADPRTPQITGAPFATLFSSARCAVLLARGERDTKVTLDELRAYCPQALDLANTGHNAHVEAPAEIVALEQRWRAAMR